MTTSLAQVLESIRPTTGRMVIDLVAEAGIDVAPWHVKKDGRPAKRPNANPHYCYEWAFGGADQPTALCVWHRAIKVGRDAIEYADNLRRFALRLDEIAIEPRNPADVRSRARDQAKRARSFDSLLQRACRRLAPIRVILLEGDDKGAEQLGWNASKVRYRALDVESWYVRSYSNDDGAFELVRGIQPSEDGQRSSKNGIAEDFVDQFSLPAQAERIKREATVIPRSQEVRRRALERAGGFCEFCGARGFTLANGAIYLETHHVIPLAEDGPDIEWNVVAICPNDHRRVHYGEDRADIRAAMIEKLIQLEPKARDVLTGFADGEQ